MKSLSHVIYASRAADDFAEHQIPSLLKQARLANAKRQITGMLVYVGGAFYQVIEGETGMVEAVYAAIQRDRRHEHVTRIAAETIAHRSFEGWTLGHATIDPIDAGELVGDREFFTLPSCVMRTDIARAKKLLWSLSKPRWEIGRETAASVLGRTA